MDRLVEAEGAVRRATRTEGGRGEHAEGAGQHGGLVREDVAKEVLGDDHIEGGRPGCEEHCGGIDEAMLQLDVGVVSADLSHDLAPEAARREHVRLINGGHRLSSRARQLKGDHGNTMDLIFVIRQRVNGAATCWRHLFTRRLAEVETAGELAHHEHVNALQTLGLQR